VSEQTRNTVDGQVSTGAIVQAASIGAVHHHTHAAPQQPTAPPVQLPVEAAYFEDRDTERTDTHVHWCSAVGAPMWCGRWSWP